MPIRLDLTGNGAVLTINRPEALNALSFGLLSEIDGAIGEVDASAARVLIVTGAGDRAFCAGADIAELRHRSLGEQKAGIELGQRVFNRIDSLRIPSIAAINGYAFGGGLELALACTFRIAAATAKMGLPEIKLGLIPGYGGTQRLPRAIGEARALDMILTGRTVTAAEALSMGLVGRIAEGDVLEAAEALAGTLADYSQPILGFARSAVRRAASLGLVDGLTAEAETATLAYRTDDAEEGMAAFVEKRAPAFKDQ